MTNDTVYAVGERVMLWGTTLYGQVTEVSDWDGDMDDYDRTIGIPPSVTVVFDDGTADTYRCNEYPRGGWGPDEVPLMAAEELTRPDFDIRVSREVEDVLRSVEYPS
jgi:hypothetical protein